jgi:hypothetical protein
MYFRDFARFGEKGLFVTKLPGPHLQSLKLQRVRSRLIVNRSERAVELTMLSMVKLIMVALCS